jgi:hypothetical protein
MPTSCFLLQEEAAKQSSAMARKKGRLKNFMRAE